MSCVLLFWRQGVVQRYPHINMINHIVKLIHDALTPPPLAVMDGELRHNSHVMILQFCRLSVYCRFCNI